MPGLANAAELPYGGAGGSGSKFWSGPNRMVQRRDYYPPFERGGEADGWPSTISPQPPPAQQTDNHAAIGLSFFENFVFDDPELELYEASIGLWIPTIVENKVVVPRRNAWRRF